MTKMSEFQTKMNSTDRSLVIIMTTAIMSALLLLGSLVWSSHLREQHRITAVQDAIAKGYNLNEAACAFNTNGYTAEHCVQLLKK